MATDKHGTDIAPGDTVELVYGGDYHQMVVESLGEDHGTPTLTGKVTVTHPAPATKVVGKAKKPAKKATEPEEVDG